MTLQQPPHTYGKMILSDEQAEEISLKLVDIRDSFEPTDEEMIPSTQYITAKYNLENEFKINGDTCEALISQYNSVEEVTSPIEEV